MYLHIKTSGYVIWQTNASYSLFMRYGIFCALKIQLDSKATKAFAHVFFVPYKDNGMDIHCLFQLKQVVTACAQPYLFVSIQGFVFFTCLFFFFYLLFLKWVQYEGWFLFFEWMCAATTLSQVPYRSNMLTLTTKTTKIYFRSTRIYVHRSVVTLKIIANKHLFIWYTYLHNYDLQY